MKNRRGGIAGAGWDLRNSLSSPRGGQEWVSRREVRQKADLPRVSPAPRLRWLEVACNINITFSRDVGI